MCFVVTYCVQCQFIHRQVFSTIGSMWLSVSKMRPSSPSFTTLVLVLYLACDASSTFSNPYVIRDVFKAEAKLVRFMSGLNVTNMNVAQAMQR